MPLYSHGVKTQKKEREIEKKVKYKKAHINKSPNAIKYKHK